MIFATKKGRVDCFDANDKFINYLKDIQKDGTTKEQGERDKRGRKPHTKKQKQWNKLALLRSILLIIERKESRKLGRAAREEEQQ
jgi:hypothetical protein